jgi:hypothetical protein
MKNMGTNYDLHKNICGTCNRPEKILHIGKSSFGWTFSFRAYDEWCIHSSEDWKREIPQGKIFDEYGKEVTEKEFWELVEAKKVSGRKHAQDYPSSDDWLDSEGNSFSRREFS